MVMAGFSASIQRQQGTTMITTIKRAMRIAAELRNAVLKGYRRATPVVLAGLMLAACSATQDINAAQEAIAHFHDMMSAGQVEQIYAQADDGFKKATTEVELKRFLSVVDRRLGAVKSSENTGWVTNYGTAGLSVTLTYKTQFEHGTGADTFRYRFADGKALLAYYHVDSNAFVLN
jgi:hypothetical protein